eukprot:601727-Hanusia_phi.AAC.1
MNLEGWPGAAQLLLGGLQPITRATPCHKVVNVMHREARVEELEEELERAREARGGGGGGGGGTERYGWYPQKKREGFMERTSRVSRKPPQACNAMLNFLISSTHRRKRRHKTNIVQTSEEGWKLAADNAEDKVFEASSRVLSEHSTQFNLNAPARILHLWGDLRTTRHLVMILLAKNRARVGMIERGLEKCTSKQEMSALELEFKETELEVEALARQSERLRDLIEAAEERFLDDPIIPPLLFQELQGCQWPLGRAIGDEKEFVWCLSTAQLEEVLREVLRGIKTNRKTPGSTTGRSRAGKERGAELTYDAQDHGGFFERDEMEDFLVETLSELDDAIVPLQAFFRRLLGVKESKNRREMYTAEDEGMRLIQSFARRMLQGFQGRELILEYRRRARLEKLGADTQILDMLLYAEDGDSFTVPKGHHYPKVTNLAEEMSSFEDKVRVLCAQDIREGSVIVVGKETMFVREKNGNELVVERKPPRILWQMMEAYMKLNLCRSQEDCVSGIWGKFIGIAQHYKSEATVLLEADWINGVKALLGYDRDAEFTMRSGSVEDISFTRILIRCVEQAAEAEEELCETCRQGGAGNELVDRRIWNTKFSFQDHDRITVDVPNRIFSIRTFDLVVEGVEERFTARGCVGGVLPRCSASSLLEKFPQDVVLLGLASGCLEMESIVLVCLITGWVSRYSRMWMRIASTISKAIRIFSEKEATLHCSLTLESKDVKVYKRNVRLQHGHTTQVVKPVQVVESGEDMPSPLLADCDIFATKTYTTRGERQQRCYVEAASCGEQSRSVADIFENM